MLQPLFRLLFNAHTAFPPTASTTAAWSATDPVSSALDLLPSHEKAAVLRFHFPRDAALSLGSFLLKHLAIVHAIGVTWAESVVEANRNVNNGKPFYGLGGVQFNVSHHGAMVVLVASVEPEVNVGIDVVKIDLERDMAAISRAGGWTSWVRIFQDVFSEEEIREIIAGDLGTPQEALEKSLRRFYAFWALKEAYIKMTGEALMADWLRDLEFKRVTVPKPVEADGGMNGIECWGEVLYDFEVWLRGNMVENVRMELVALGREYMVATAVEGGEKTGFSSFLEIEVGTDVLPVATKWDTWNDKT